MEFRDLKKQYKFLKEQIDKQINTVLEEGHFINGPEVAELEDKLADYTNMKYCVSCANGTDALTLVLMARQIGEGDAVFVPNFTFAASAGCAAVLGAKVIFTDITADTFSMSAQSLEVAIKQVLSEGKYTPKAVIPVDLFGLVCTEIEEIRRIASKYGIFVLEDGAQGFGATLDDHKACSFGDAAITSFFPAKPLGCYGDGGAIFTNDMELAEIICSIKAQGRSPQDKYYNTRVGINSRLDTLQAAVLLAKFETFAKFELDSVNKAAAMYSKRLSSLPGVRTPLVPDRFTSSWAQYTIRTEKRDSLQQFLRSKGIPSMIYYPICISKQPAYAGRQYESVDLSNSVAASRSVLSLPIHPYIEENEICQICDAIAEHQSLEM